MTCYRAGFGLLVGLLAASSASLPSSAVADTPVGGSITTNTTWGAAGSPYVVSSNVSVKPGATLTIDAGTTVRFNAQLRTIYVSGTLRALGTAASPVVMTSSQAATGGGAPGQYEGIILLSGGTGVLQHVAMHWGGYGTSAYGYGLVYAQGAGTTLTVEDSVFDHSQTSGIGVSSNATATIRTSAASDNANGISVVGAVATIADSTLASNSRSGLFVNNGSTSGPDATTIDRSDITTNGRTGVEVQVGCGIPVSRWPHGRKNNISLNGAQAQVADGNQLSSSQSCVGLDVDWRDNYWGPTAYLNWGAVLTTCQGFEILGYHPKFGAYLAESNPHGSLGWSAPYPPGAITTGTTVTSGTSPPFCQVPVIYHPYNVFNLHGQIQPAYMPNHVPVPTGPNTFGGSNPAAPNQIAACEGDPVICAIGDFTESFGDLDAGGRGLGLLFGRTYNSQGALLAPAAGQMGRGWTFAFGDALAVDPSSGAVTVTHANGSTVTFDRNADGSFSSPPWVQAKLLKISGGYRYTLPDQTSWVFSDSGALQSVADRNGNTTSLAYSGGLLTTITDAAGRSITLAHNGDGTISRATDPDGHHVDYQYDANQDLTSVADVAGKSTSFTYDASHQITVVTDPRGGVLRNTYDGQGRVISQQDPASRTTAFDYVAGGTNITTSAGVTAERFTGSLLMSVTKAYGTSDAVTATFDYDSSLNPLVVTDGRGRATHFTYDSAGNQLSVDDPLHRIWRRTYDSAHNVTSVTDPQSRITYLDRDAAGNLSAARRTRTEDGVSVLTDYDFDSYGQLASVTDPLGRITTYAHDAAGNVTSVRSPMGNLTTSAYDPDGHLASVTSPRGNATGGTPGDFTTSYVRDAYGNALSVSDPLGGATTMVYDENQNLTDVTDPGSRHTVIDYNADDEPTVVHRPGGSTTRTVYDTAGRIVQQVNAAGTATTYAYDGLSRVKQVTDPLNRTEARTYDGAGNLKTLLDAAGRTTTFTYDDAGQLQLTHYSSGTPSDIGYTYDSAGRRASMTDSTGTTSYGFNSLGQLTTVTKPGAAVTTYTVDKAGQVTGLRYPSSTDTVTRTYDADSRLQGVTDWLSHATTFAYDEDSSLTRVVRSNGTATTYTHDRAGAVTSVTDPVAGNVTYARAANGQVASVSRGGAPASVAAYDGLKRLTGLGADSYEFDAADRLSRTLNASGVSARQSFDAGDQLQASTRWDDAGALASFTYDAQGQRSGATDGSGAASYSYDQAGRLTRYSGPDRAATGSVVESYTYDGDGARQAKDVGSATTAEAYDLSGSLPTMIQDGAVRYITGPGGLPIEEVSGSTARYYHQDQLGSTVGLSSQAGAVVSTYDYDATGNPRGTPAASVPFGFAGQYTDAHSGLQYLRARYYDPSTGQFLTRDPLASQTRDVYGYAAGDPLNHDDPTGLSAVDDLVGAGEAAGNALAGAADGFTGGVSTTALRWAGLSPGTCTPAFNAGQIVGIAAIFAVPAYAELRAGMLGLRLRTVGGAAKAGETIDPALVRFSQDSIKGAFQNGGSVDDLAAGLKSGTIKPGDVPSIRVVERDGNLFTLDNRRLEAFRRAGVPIRYRHATPEEVTNEASKFTTRNGGQSVRVRGG